MTGYEKGAGSEVSMGGTAGDQGSGAEKGNDLEACIICGEPRGDASPCPICGSE